MADADPITPRALAGRATSLMSARRGVLAALLPLSVAPASASAASQPVDASAATTSLLSDAELIAACREVCEAQVALDALLRDHPALTLDQERAQAPLTTALHARITRATGLAAALPALTAAGLLAKAQAALAVGEKDEAGSNIALDDPAWLMLSAVEDLADVLGALGPAPVPA